MHLGKPVVHISIYHVSKFKSKEFDPPDRELPQELDPIANSPNNPDNL